MFCRRCGTQSDEGVLFCYKCGAKLDEAVAEIKAEDSAEVKKIQSQYRNAGNEEIRKSEISNSEIKNSEIKNSGKKPVKLAIAIGAAALVIVAGIVMLFAGRGTEEAKKDKDKNSDKKTEKSAEEYQVSIDVYNAEGIYLNSEETSTPIIEAQAVIRNGFEEYEGEGLEVSADSVGKIITELEEGDYTIQLDADGYMTSYFEVSVSDKEETMSAYLVPTISEGTTAAVLTWNEPTVNLDLVLFKQNETNNEESSYISWCALKDDAGNRLVSDNDYGCEVLYMNTEQAVDYKLFVNDYINNISREYNSNILSKVEPVIYIYDSTGYVAKYEFPKDNNGVVWEAVKINQKELSELQQVHSEFQAEKWITLDKDVEKINQERMAAYERFLNEEEEVYIDSKTYYLGDLASKIYMESEAPINDIHEMLDAVEYAFIDCGLDGKQELLVQFIGLDMYTIYDDDCGVGFVISYNDGKLVCIEDWYYRARDWYDISYSGVISGEGSGGATAGETSMRIVNADGITQWIYESEYDLEWGLYGYSEYLDGKTSDYKEIDKLLYYYALETGQATDGIWYVSLDDMFSIYTIGDKEYYVPLTDENWKRYLEENGQKCYTEEELQEVINAYAAQLIGNEEKANEILSCEKEIKWKTWARPYNFKSISELSDSKVEFWFDNSKKITKYLYNVVTYNRMYDFNADGVNEVVFFTEDTYRMRNGQNILVYDVSKGTAKEVEWEFKADEYCEEQYGIYVSEYDVKIITLDDGRNALQIDGYKDDSNYSVVTFVLEYEDEEWRVH